MPFKSGVDPCAFLSEIRAGGYRQSKVQRTDFLFGFFNLKYDQTKERIQWLNK